MLLKRETLSWGRCAIPTENVLHKICISLCCIKVSFKSNHRAPFRLLILRYSTLLSFHRVLHERDSMKRNNVATYKDRVQLITVHKTTK